MRNRYCAIAVLSKLSYNQTVLFVYFMISSFAALDYITSMFPYLRHSVLL